MGGRSPGEEGSNSLRNSGARPGGTVAVQEIGELGRLAIQFASRMRLRAVALSSGSNKKELARQLGAREYIDTSETDAEEGLQRLGGSDLVLATAPNSEAIERTVAGPKSRAKLLIVALPQKSVAVSVSGLLSGRTVAGWPSGSAIDSEDTEDAATLVLVV